MAPLDASVCEPWPLEPSCFDIPEDVPPATVTMWNQIATDLLWALTGRRLGPDCPITVRPCRKTCADGWASRLSFWPAGYNGSPWIPYVGTDGQMRNATLCGCAQDCHCGSELCQIWLPGPVYDIVTVDLDGVVVDPATYQVVNGRYLRRLTDITVPDMPVNGCWPTCQDLSLASGQPGTFTVTYRTGLALPEAAKMAVTQLTAHFIRGCDGGGCGCGVGTRQNLQRLSRQGVDLEFADPQQVFTDGRTGIELVDQFIRAYNPLGLGGQLRVLSPDAPRRPEIWR